MSALALDELVQPEKGRVHASVYTDSQIFDEEMRRIFFATWVFVAHESELPKNGSFVTTYVGRVPLIVCRDDEGKLGVLVNRCVHRGATVCQLERGEAKHFRCEYHAWTYDLHGRLIGVSRPDGYAAIELAEIPNALAHAPRVESFAGLIFANFSASGPTLREHLGLAATYLEDWADMAPSGRLEVDGGAWKTSYNGNWKLQLEGSTEGYHPDFLHRIGRLANDRNGNARLEGFATSQAAGIDLGGGHSLMEYPPMNATTPATAEWIARLAERVGVERATHVITHPFRMQLFPNLGISVDQIRIIRPIGPEVTEVWQYHVTATGAPDAINRARIRKHREFNGPSGYGSPDDVEIFERIQEGVRSLQWPGALPWVFFNRGVTQERRGDHGERVGHTSSEVQQRAIYYEWLRLMRAGADAPLGAAVPGWR
jgi:phenylpropionate dioxygenase-like ring-hydroxylating dioxygenase large terminal subunit